MSSLSSAAALTGGQTETRTLNNVQSCEGDYRFSTCVTPASSRRALATSGDTA